MKKKKKKAKGGAKPPSQKVFDVALPSGQTVQVTMAPTMEVIDRPLKVETGATEQNGILVPRMQKVRKDGVILTASVRVRGYRVHVRFADGTELVARSCCKPPDVYRRRTALRLAMNRITKLDAGISLQKFEPGGKPLREKTKRKLDKLDRQALFVAVMRGGKPLESVQDDVA